MASIYDDVEIEDMEFDPDLRTFFFPCPCGDRFAITLDELLGGEEIASCPSCSLKVRVIYEPELLEAFEHRAEADAEGSVPMSA